MKSVPSEFAVFVRDAGVRAFDRLATLSKELDAPLRAFAKSWSRLTATQKDDLFDRLVAIAQLEEMPAPEAPPKRVPKKRYAPEEVELPKKPKKKTAAKKKAAPKKKPTG
ncbi:MAG TPA: hypothetical protein VF618_03680 [Thermoanaerobaculia bacterium]